MRVGFFFSEIFWGALLILIGISAVLKSFNVNIPIFRLIFAFLFIYVGITILFGHGVIYEKDKNIILFSTQEIEIGKTVEKDYNILFGKGVIDLTNISVEGGRNETELNTIFGSSIIKINAESPIKIVVSSAFGNATLPDGSNITFGESTYISPTYQESKQKINLKATVVFGNMNIVRR